MPALVKKLTKKIFKNLLDNQRIVCYNVDTERGDKMKCEDCIYYYPGPGDELPSCQVKWRDEPAPCKQENEDEEREDEK